ncbi:MAG: hypothetical protein KTR26_13790 [Flammeovirgaceae bacterium]|nr:hypothetical protein [Flammeovirgaceae bacterium]
MRNRSIFLGIICFLLLILSNNLVLGQKSQRPLHKKKKGTHLNSTPRNTIPKKPKSLYVSVSKKGKANHYKNEKRLNVKAKKAKNINAPLKKYSGFSKQKKAKSKNRSLARYSGAVKVRKGKKQALNNFKKGYVKIGKSNTKRTTRSIKRYAGSIKVSKKRSSSRKIGSFRGEIAVKRRRQADRRKARYTGGPTNAIEKAKYRNAILKNTRQKGRLNKKPGKKRKKIEKLKYDSRESKIWNN